MQCLTEDSPLDNPTRYRVVDRELASGNERRPRSRLLKNSEVPGGQERLEELVGRALEHRPLWREPTLRPRRSTMQATVESPRYRTVCQMTTSSARLAAPDGWDIQELPARVSDGQAERGEWEGRSITGGRIVAATAERLLARLWAAAARAVEQGGAEWDSEEF